MGLKEKRDDVYRTFVYQRQRKEICPISRAYNILENRLVSLFVKIVLNFGYCLFFFSFSMKVFPLLLLNSCEDYSSGSGIVTTGKGNV